MTGREALRPYFGTPPADRLSRRLMTNILVTVTTPDTANATVYLTPEGRDDWLAGLAGHLPPVREPD